MEHSNYTRHILKQTSLHYFWGPLNYKFTDFQEPFKGVVKLILVNAIRSIKYFHTIRALGIPRIDSWIAFSSNKLKHKNILTPLQAILEEEYGECPSTLFPHDKGIQSLIFGYYGLRYAIHHMVWYFSLQGIERKAYRNKFWHCYYNLGCYRYMFLQMKKSKSLKVFVGSNDHIGNSKIGFVAARNAGIKSVYIQHASVTDKFPPLDVDLALLDGEDARSKYRIAPDRKTEIRLIGSMKYDDCIPLHQKPSPNAPVGVCVNLNILDYDKVLEMCMAMEKQGISFILRFHPHIKAEYKSPFVQQGWSYSQPNERETSFILKCKAVISGDSNILLDTVVLGRTPIYYKPIDDQHTDYYGFLRNGLIKHKFESVNSILDYLGSELNEYSVDRQKLKYYVETIDTENEGRSSYLALHFIKKMVNRSTL